MRSLERNKRPIYYASFVSETDNVDDNGNYDGTKTLNYSAPKRYCINYSEQSGETSLDNFGLNRNYDVRLVTNDMNCPLYEDTRLWIGKKPGANVPHNYVVTRRSESINGITITARRVETNA